MDPCQVAGAQRGDLWNVASRDGFMLVAAARAGRIGATPGTKPSVTIVIDKELLEILACPQTHQPLSEASAAQLESLNKAIKAGTVKNVGGDVVSETLDGGLIRQDGTIVYPIRDEIPVLLIDEGIGVEA
jgi:uncharacterized protein